MPPVAAKSVPIPPTLPDVGFVRLRAILGLIPVGKSTWWAGIRSGKYPAPVKLGPRVSAWRVEDIRELLATLARDLGTLQRDAFRVNAY